MLLERLQNFVRIQFEVSHDLTEHVPFHLREGEADVLVGQQRVVAPARLVERAVDDTLSRLSQFVLRDVEILHGVPPSKLILPPRQQVSSQFTGAH